MHPPSGAKGVLPAQTHVLHRGTFRRNTDQCGIPGPVGLAERMPARDQRDGLVVVHRHPGKGFTDVAGRGHRIGIAVRTFGVDVDQPHLHCRQRLFQHTVAGIAFVIQPDRFRPPVDVFLRLPGIGPPAAKAKGLQPHIL